MGPRRPRVRRSPGASAPAARRPARGWHRRCGTGRSRADHPPRPAGPLVLALATAGVLGVTGLSGAGAAEPLTVVTVAPGQTLSEIAAAQLPDLSVSNGIVAIQVANELNSAQVSAGQHLVIPAG